MYPNWLGPAGVREKRRKESNAWMESQWDMAEGCEAAARQINSEAAKIGLSTAFGSCYKIESDVLLLL